MIPIKKLFDVSMKKVDTFPPDVKTIVQEDIPMVAIDVKYIFNVHVIVFNVIFGLHLT